MIDYDTLTAHLKRTGRMKLLPRILKELQVREAKTRALTSRKETVKDRPDLISGWRSIENGILTDRTGKRALLDIYQRIVKSTT